MVGKASFVTAGAVTEILADVQTDADMAQHGHYGILMTGCAGGPVECTVKIVNLLDGTVKAVGGGTFALSGTSFKATDHDDWLRIENAARNVYVHLTDGDFA